MAIEHQIKDEAEKVDENTRFRVISEAIRDRLKALTNFDVEAADLEEIENDTVLGPHSSLIHKNPKKVVPPHAFMAVPEDEFGADGISHWDGLEMADGLWGYYRDGSVTIYAEGTEQKNKRIEEATSNGTVTVRVDQVPKSVFEAHEGTGESPEEVVIDGRRFRIPYVDLLPGEMEAPNQTLLSIAKTQAVDAPIIVTEIDGEGPPTVIDGHTRLKLIETLRYKGIPVDSDVKALSPMNEGDALDRALKLNTHNRNIGVEERREIINELKDRRRWSSYDEPSQTELAELLCVSPATINRDIKSLKTREGEQSDMLSELRSKQRRTSTLSNGLRQIRSGEIEIDVPVSETDLDKLIESIEEHREKIDEEVQRLEKTVDYIPLDEGDRILYSYYSSYRMAVVSTSPRTNSKQVEVVLNDENKGERSKSRIDRDKVATVIESDVDVPEAGTNVPESEIEQKEEAVAELKDGG